VSLDNPDIKVPLSHHKKFDLRWITTVNKTQGRTITRKFTIHESNMMDKYSLYTAISRGTRVGQIIII